MVRFVGPRFRLLVAQAVVVALVAGAVVTGAGPVPDPAPAGAASTAGPFSATGCDLFNDTFSGLLPGLEGCGQVDYRYDLLVNGVRGTTEPLKVGDKVTIEVVVTPRGGHDAMYLAGLDLLKPGGGQLSVAARLPIGFPTQPGILSPPDMARLDRTDLGDRGQGPALDCLTQKNDRAPENSPGHYVQLGSDQASLSPSGPFDIGSAPSAPRWQASDVGPNWRQAGWDSLGYDRCVKLASRNGIYAGFGVQVTQTVLALPPTGQDLTWSVGPLRLRVVNYEYGGTEEFPGVPLAGRITWGGTQTISRAIPAGVGAPTIGSATAGVGSATVSWTAPTQGAVEGYLLRAEPVAPFPPGGPFSVWGMRVNDPAATGATIHGPVPGVTYRFQVLAIGPGWAVGPWSGWSNSVVILAPAPVGEPPGVPTGLTVRPGDGTIAVDWAAPASNGGQPIQGYTLRICTVEGGSCRLDKTSGGATDAQIPSANGQVVTVEVAATNVMGESVFSTPSEWVRAGSVVMECVTDTVPGTQGEAADLAVVAPASVAQGSRFNITFYPGTIPVRPSILGFPISSFSNLQVTYPVPAGFKPLSARIGFGGYQIGPGTPTVAVANGKVTITVPGPIPSGTTALWPTAVVRGEANGAVGSSITTKLGGTGQTDPGYALTVAALATVRSNCYPTDSPTLSNTTIAPPVWAPFQSANAFTTQQFADLAGRAPTAAELTDWSEQMRNYVKAPANLADDLRSAAHWEPTLGPVVRLYSAYFLRPPDTSGLTYWVGRSRAGTSLNSISSAFAGSGEFKRRYGSLSNLAFVNLVYQNVLGRPGDAGGVAYWKGQLDQGKKTRGQVMVGFSESGEYKRRTATAVAATSITFGLLRRVPTAAELTAMKARLGADTQPSELMAEVISSTEYFERL